MILCESQFAAQDASAVRADQQASASRKRGREVDARAQQSDYLQRFDLLIAARAIGQVLEGVLGLAVAHAVLLGNRGFCDCGGLVGHPASRSVGAKRAKR